MLDMPKKKKDNPIQDDQCGHLQKWMTVRLGKMGPSRAVAPHFCPSEASVPGGVSGASSVLGECVCECLCVYVESGTDQRDRILRPFSPHFKENTHILLTL